MWFKLLPVLLLAECAATSSAIPNASAKPDFPTFYQTFRTDVMAQGLNPDMLDAAFPNGPQPYGKAIELEQKQPETQLTFPQYVQRILTETRRTQAAQLHSTHLQTLTDIANRTGVPTNVMVALWGVESNFGSNMGNHPVIPSLVTLAWHSHRPDFFRSEAIAALKVAQQQRMEPLELVGSWAGAMGQCQFMPSNFLRHAVDGDGDGRADIWNTPADVFASTANFLAHLGWKTNTPWRLPARISAPLPEEPVAFNERGLSKPHTIAQWQKWGVIPAGKPFTAFGDTATATRLYRPLGNDGPTYMLGPNFDVILRWNMSSYFAASVLLLADSITNNGALPDV